MLSARGFNIVEGKPQFLFGVFFQVNALEHVASLAPIAGNLPGCNKSMYVNDSRPL